MSDGQPWLDASLHCTCAYFKVANTTTKLQREYNNRRRIRRYKLRFLG